MPTPRSPREFRSRSGITLTEILISIMIMGVGLLALATLFPLGILRIREAQRATRSALLTESAEGDLQSRNLLSSASFAATWYGSPPRSTLYDPFVYDPIDPNNASTTGGIFPIVGSGLPVAYDPLWWYELGSQTSGATNPVSTASNPDQARFGFGIGFLRDDPSGGTPSAYGLQRLTNFPFTTLYNIPINPELVFASSDDLILQTEGRAEPVNGTGSPLAPDLSTGGILADLSYTWMFTGKRSDITNSTVFDGDIVLFHNRAFAYEPVNSPLAGSFLKAAGETVVEAIWGYGPPTGGATPYYSVNETTVLLRWPASVPDPDIRVGGWIADITYERTAANSSRFSGFYPGQRCHWYRIVNRTNGGDGVSFSGDPGAYRQMTVTVSNPVRARSLLTTSGGVVQPVHVEAALISPSVVNVYPRTITLR